MSQVAEPSDRLDEVMSRLDRIEARLDRLVGVLDHALPAVAMAADAADELARDAAGRGVDLDARGQAALQLVETVTEPATLERVGALVAQLEKLEPVIALAAGFDDTVAMAADGFDAWANDQVAGGVDLDARGAVASRLLMRVTEPATARSLERLLDALPTLEPVVQLASSFEDTVAMSADVFDAWANDQVAAGIDLDARVRTALTLAEVATRPENAEAAVEVLQQLPKLRTTVTLAAGLDDTIAMAADMFDAWANDQVAHGVDMDARARTALELLEVVTRPEQAASAKQALELLPRLQSTLVLAATFDDTVAMAADTFDAWAAEQASRGIDIGARVTTAVRFLETVTEPKNAAVAERMVQQLPHLEPLVHLATTFEPTTAMLFDMFDEHVRTWIDRGIDAEERFLQVASLVERLTDPVFHTHLETLIDAAPNLMAATRTGEMFGLAVDRVSADQAAPMGAWALFRALGDPEVQRAAGFAVAVARQVGRDLPTGTVPATT